MSNLKPSNGITQKRGRWLMGAVVVLVSGILLAACQPAAQPAAAGQSQAGNGQRPNFQMQPAPELPTDRPALRGALVSLNGTTLTVQEGGGFGGGSFGGSNGAPQNGTPRPRPT